MAALSLRKLLRLSALLAGVRLCAAAVGLLTQLVLARWLGAGPLGSYVLALSFGSALSTLCALGFPSVTSKFVSRYRVEGRPDLITGFVRSSRWHLIAMTVVLATAIAVVHFAPVELIPQDMRLPLMVGAFTAPFLGFLRLNGALANAAKRFLVSYLPDMLLRPILALGLIAAVMLLFPSAGVTAILAGQVGIVAAVASVQAWMLRRGATPLARGVDVEFRTRDWRSAALPMVLAVLFTSYVADLNLLMVGLILPPEDVAVFSVCLRLALVMGFGIQVTYQLTLPDLSDAFARNERVAIERAVGRANVLNIGGIGLGSAALLLVGPTLLRLFGPEFERGYFVLIVLSLAQLIVAAAGPNTQLLNLGGSQRLILKIFGLGFVVLAALNTALASRFGVEGAAVAFLLSVAVWSSLLSLGVWRKLGYRPFLLHLPVDRLPQPLRRGRIAKANPRHVGHGLGPESTDWICRAGRSAR